MAIFFHSEQIKFSIKNKNALKSWINSTVQDKNFRSSRINIIFTSDSYLIEINKEYLSHDYFTDVITFNYSDEFEISGDIYISIDTVKTNSEKYNVSYEKELYRVIIHGVLHLLGYDDKNEDTQKIMKKSEDYYLDLLRKGIEF